MSATKELSQVKPSEIFPNEGVLEVFPIDVFTLGTVKESVRLNGIMNPILIGTDRVIIDGHTRWTAAQELGIKTVPVKVLDMEGRSEAGVDFAIEWQMGRRNLKTKEKMEKVALTLQLHPTWSDRRISKRYGVSPTSVGNVRKALKNGGKITAALDDEGNEVREGADGTKQKTSGKSRNQSSAEKPKKLPSVLLADPTVTAAEVGAMEFDVDQLNAIRRWADVLGKYLRSNPKPVSAEQKKAEAQKAKDEAKRAKELEKIAAKKKALEEAEEAVKSGKAPAKAARKAAKKAPAKKAAKKGARK